jgi:uncharacterized protein VirK/YbjX
VTISWAWRVSKEVMPQFKMRARFVAAALREPEISQLLANADPNSPIGKLLGEQPQTAGILISPYQCAAWGAKTRFARLSAHLEAVRQIPGLDLDPDEKLVLADLSSFSPGTSLILDRAPWLAREGHLTLSLFKDEFRAFTVSFSLSGFPETELFIGGLQGRQSEEILAIYRDLTKDFGGIRPRDFMLEMLRLFAVNIGVRHIYAVADAHKISRHKYFEEKGAPGLFYDDVWQERSGERVAETHFELPLGGSRRPLDEIAAKKRSMYRRRYEMLDQIEAALPGDLTKAERRRFEAK